MLQVQNVSIQFPDKTLFDEVDLVFSPGNCYGIIGANGTGKSTFLSVLSGEREPSTGHVSLGKNDRLSILKQDHYQYDQNRVLDVVMMGNPELIKIQEEKDAIYMKEDFTEEDGLKAGELEERFAELGGWQAESDAATLLEGLGIPTTLHDKILDDLVESDKVKVMLAQALFGEPDVLLLDEPTNGLDIAAVLWLQDFLMDFKGAVIVVSHDRYFLNEVCTHMVDIDFGKIQLFVGNYDFWYESSQLAQRMMKEENKKKEEQIKELKNFIARFSANKSKSRQATSRKKLLDKISLNDIKPSSRRYPFVGFELSREPGNELLTIEGLHKKDGEDSLIQDFSFRLNHDDKVAFVGNERAITALFEILMGHDKDYRGEFKWGQTITTDYFPKDNTEFFQNPELNLVDWLRQYSKDQTETHIRGFLGKMLFSGDEVYKPSSVLSGGEKVRMMFSKMMMSPSNVLIFDQPTNHLDLESITAVNNGLMAYKGSLLFTSKDHQFIDTIANRVVEFFPDGTYRDRSMSYDDYLDEYVRK